MEYNSLQNSYNIQFESPWLKEFIKDLNKDYKKALEEKKYNEFWELIKKNTWK